MVKKYGDLYLQARRALLPTEGENAAAAARELLAFASGKSVAAVLADANLYASEQIEADLNGYVNRMLAHEPLPYILGQWNFYGISLEVTPDVLIPRDDTMAVTDLALEVLRTGHPSPRVLDLCCGSGCIGLAIAHQLPDAHVTLADISRPALAVAKRNIKRLKLMNRVTAIGLDAKKPAPSFVGTLDALADVTGVCLLMELLAPEQVLASPVHVGSGQVRCAHGILPVPAPATALLLEGIPIYGGSIRGELCTPTGAALLRRFVTRFGPLPPMRVEKTGYGMGTKDFEAANCVRAMLGQTEESAGHILELACNLDDMTPEAVGFAMEQLFAAGALDVYTTPIGMKKNRPGVLLTCMCREDDREAMLRTIFRHTSTLGVRVSVCDRYTLSRRQYAVQTPDGEIRVKESSGWGVLRRKAEFEDLARIARQTGKSIAEVLDTISETK